MSCYGTVAAVVCVCDSMNYILEEEDLTEVFRLVNNYLDPGGHFRVRPEYTLINMQELLGDATRLRKTGRIESFIWENAFYDPEDQVNEYDLYHFCAGRRGACTGNTTETHYRAGLDAGTGERPAWRQAGMEFVGSV